MQKVVVLLLFTFLSVAARAQTDAPAYVLQLKPESRVLDARAAAEQVARTYGGELVAGDGALGGQYVVKVSASRARMMSADHRVAALTPVADALSAAEWSGGISYTYDGSGNITAAGADQFTYDAVNRIKVSTVAGEKRTYTYDAYGNRTACQKTDGAACEQAAPVDAATNRINSAGVIYDGAGNLTSANGRTYTYDALNTLTSETYGNNTREYVYTAGGERIAVHDVAGQWWQWTVRGLDEKVLREFTSRDGANGALGTNDWKWTKDYVWRDGLLLATVQPNAAGTGTTTYHYHLDHLGTPRMVTDSNGFVVGLHDYHPFGSEAANPLNESPLTAMKFTGHERDTIAGQNDALDYMHARFYNPQWGRFLSVDPAKNSVDRAMPQSWNRYSYALNNPVRYTDPDGRCVSALPCPAWLVVGTETAATQVGTRAAAGSAAGPIGVAVASAGVTGWQIGRAIGTSTIGGRTIDSRVQGLFISMMDNTQHGDDRANDPDRAVDRDKVKANGEVYVDAQTGATVYVHGGQVVIENEAGQLISQWNDQTAKETKKKEKDGKWRKKPKDQIEPEIE